MILIDHDDKSSIPRDCLSSWAIVFLSASSSSVRQIVGINYFVFNRYKTNKYYIKINCLNN